MFAKLAIGIGKKFFEITIVFKTTFFCKKRKHYFQNNRLLLFQKIKNNT